MNKIIEKTLKIGDDKNLSQLVIEEYGEYWEEKYSDYYCHLIYIDTEPKQIIYARLWDQKFPEIKKPCFVDLLETIDYTDFNSLLLLVSTYPDYTDISEKACISLEKSKNPFKSKNTHLDNLFKETNGWLLFGYQLERLYMTCVETRREKATEFRKNVNKKHADRLNEYYEIEMFGTKFEDIMTERMKFRVVRLPLYNDAYRLYMYLTRLKTGLH